MVVNTKKNHKKNHPPPKNQELKNSYCEEMDGYKTQKLKLWKRSETLIVTKLKN